MFKYTARSGVEVESIEPRIIPLQDRFYLAQFLWSYQYTFKKVIRDWWKTRGTHD
jgi:hypothetical protein